MKKLLLFCFLSVALKCIPQSVNFGRHHGLDRVGNIVSVNSKSFYFEADEVSCCYKKLIFTGVGSTGDTLFEKELSLTAGMWPFGQRLFKTNDNCLVLFGAAFQSCDVGPWKYYFAKLDTLGHVLFETDYSTPVRDMAQHSDGSYYLVSDSLLFHYSATGQFVSQISSGIKNINSITALANGHLLINGSINGVLKNNEITISANVLQQVGANSIVSKFIEAPNGILFGRTTDGKLEKYDAGLTFLNTTPASNDSIIDFTLQNDSLYTVGYNTGSKTPFYRILDNTLTPHYYGSCSYKNIVPKGISVTGKKVNIITQGTSMASHSASFRGYYQLSTGSSFVSNYNVGVSVLSVNSYTAYASQTTPPGSTPMLYNAYPDYNLNVTVKNYGNDAVNSFYLNSYLSYYDCYRTFHRLYHVAIPPHDSVIVQTGSFQGNPISVPANLQYSDVFNVNFCFYTTVPNASNDNDVSNDEYCKALALTGITFTGLKETLLDAQAVSLFPNPFHKTLQIHSEIPVLKAEIYNALGILQNSIEIKGTQVSMDMEQPAGIYFIKLTTEKGLVIKKVVKE